MYDFKTSISIANIFFFGFVRYERVDNDESSNDSESEAEAEKSADEEEEECASD